MNIGFLGLGKLGLPVSLAVEDKGHKIFGYDISKQTINDIKNRKIRYKEEWVEKYLTIYNGSKSSVVGKSWFVEWF